MYNMTRLIFSSSLSLSRERSLFNPRRGPEVETEHKVIYLRQAIMEVLQISKLVVGHRHTLRRDGSTEILTIHESIRAADGKFRRDRMIRGACIMRLKNWLQKLASAQLCSIRSMRSLWNYPSALDKLTPRG